MSSLATMTRALLYLRATSLVGQVKSRLRRLRQPKYLGGAVVGAAYVYFTFLRRFQAPPPGHRPGVAVGGFPPDLAAVLPTMGALILLIILMANWAAPRMASLAFSEAEIAFLFPAPVTRRMLVHYRLLGSQIGIVFTALILTLVFGRGRGLGGSVWIHAIGWWLILAILNLHFMGTSFVYSKLLNRTFTQRWRKVASIAAVWLLLALIVVGVWYSLKIPQRADFETARAFSDYVTSQLVSGPLSWLLAIPKLVVAPFFATGGAQFVLALGPALVLLIAHYLWVLNLEVAFEEASIARAEKRAARRQAVQKGDWRGQGAKHKAQKAPFALAAQGRPELAFLWKNLLAASSLFRPRVALVLFGIIFLGSEWIQHQPGIQGVRMAALIVANVLLVFALILGPMVARQDLRRELSNVDLLKSYPLRGWQIVLGELLTPLSILSMAIWLCLFADFLLVPSDAFAWLTPALRAGAVLAVAVLAPALLAIELLVANTAAVIFPAWTVSTANRAERGIEVLGQRIIFVVGQLLITAICIIPALLSAGLIFLLAQWLIGPITAALLTVAAVFVLLGAEAGAGIYWLGSRFERFDLSAELRA